MFHAIDEIFDYGDKHLQVAKVPRKFWPCQNCALYNECCTCYGKPDFPECKSEDRQDRKDVVFFEYFEQAPAQPRRFRNERH